MVNIKDKKIYIYIRKKPLITTNYIDKDSNVNDIDNDYDICSIKNKNNLLLKN